MANTDRSTDRNLLFGIFAWQNGLITEAQLFSAMKDWVFRKERSLGALLVEREVLSETACRQLDEMIDLHVAMHGGDVAASLASVRSATTAVNSLKEVNDEELDASLGYVTIDSDLENMSPLTTLGSATSEGTRFRILRPHARGGLGEVFVARDMELNRDVALKEIRSPIGESTETRSRFRMEAEVTGQLEHPGIVPVYGLGNYDDGRPFYAMRFIRGENLSVAVRSFHRDKMTDSQRRLAFRELLGRFVDVCDAMEYAHSRGVLHRDLKPGNVMLGSFGETLVVDWGLARVEGKAANPESSDSPRPLEAQAASDVTPTQDGKIMGTVEYMSPEQASGRLDLLGPATDVYALGAILYEILAGRPPITRIKNDQGKFDVGMTIRSVIEGRIENPRSIHRDVPKALAAVSMKALSNTLSDRYETARALADDVERWLADEPVQAWQEPITLRARRWMRSHRTLVFSTASTVLMLTIALGLSTTVLARKNNELQIANERADRNFRRAQATVDQFCTEVSEDELLNEPGMQPLRARLLEQAKEHYEAFLGESSSDPAVRNELANAHYRVGQMAVTIGTNEDAIQSFQKSATIIEELLRENGSDVGLLRQKAQILSTLGVLNRRKGEVDKGIAQLRSAIDLRKQIKDQSPDNLEDVRLYARSLKQLGTALSSIGSAEGITTLNTALSVLEPLADQFTDVSTYPMLNEDLAELYMKCASTRELKSERLELRSKSIAIQRRLTEAFPNVLRYRSDLGSLLAAFAGEYRDSDPAESERLLRETIEIEKALAKENPGVKSYSAAWGWSCDQFGFLLQQQGRLDEAEEFTRQAEQVYVELVDSEPGEIHYQNRLNQIYNLLGLIFRDRDQPEEAQQAFDSAVTVQKSLIELQPAIALHRRSLAGTYGNMARMHAYFEDYEKALQSQRESLKLWESEIERTPHELEPYRWAGESWMTLGGIETVNGNSGGAKNAYESALKRFDVLVSSDPTNRLFKSRSLAAKIGVAQSMARTEQYAVAVEQIEQLIEESPALLPAIDTALVFALAAKSVVQDTNVSSDDRDRKADEWSDRAIVFLKQLRDGGPAGSSRLEEAIESTPDFDDLKNRPAFQELIEVP